MSQRSNIWKGGVAITIFVGVLAITAPAFAQTSNDPDRSTVAADKTNSDGAVTPCDCSCGTVSEAKEETRVIYVGPRQNVPIKVKRKQRKEKSGNDQEASEPES